MREILIGSFYPAEIRSKSFIFVFFIWPYYLLFVWRQPVTEFAGTDRIVIEFVNFTPTPLTFKVQ